MNYIIIIYLWGLFNFLYIQETKSQKIYFSCYKDYMEERKHYENLQSIKIRDLNAQELSGYIEEWDGITNINLEIAKQLGIAQARYLLGEHGKAIYHYQNAFNRGYRIEHLRADVSEIYDTLKIIFPAAREYYFSSLDTNLRSRLYQMHIDDQSYRSRTGFRDNEMYRKKQHEIDTTNRELLIKIIDEHGWPGRRLIGWHHENRPSPSLIVIHNDEPYYYYFLEKIIESCANNNEPWEEAAGVLQILLMRFDYIDGHNKLKYFFIDKEGNVDFDKSLLLLNSMISLMERNSFLSFSIHLTDLHPTQDVSVLYAIKNFMSQSGIDESRIVISDEIIKANPAEIGDYYFGTKRISQ
jgi:hypothetical protein